MSEMRVVRFHKRYYIISAEYEPRPGSLAAVIAREIPSDAAEYQKWLAAQRKSAEEWEVLYEEYLSVKPGNEFTTNLPSFMRRQPPSLFAPLGSNRLEGVYIVDLDREIFSVNNEHHFKLEQVPHIEEMNAICCASFVGKVSLPDPTPTESVTDSVIEHTIQSGELSNARNNHTVRDVSFLCVAAYV